MIKKLLRASRLIISTITSSKAKRIRKKHKKIMQVTNGSKRFKTFPTMTNMKNISLITEIKFLRTLNEFICSLVKGLKIKFLHSMAKSMRMLSIKMINLKGLKNDIFKKQSWDFSSQRSSRPEVFYKKGLSYFEKFTGKHRCRSLFY